MFQIDYSYLRPKKARWLERMYNTPFPEKQSLSVWQGKNAVILPLHEVVNEGLLLDWAVWRMKTGSMWSCPDSRSALAGATLLKTPFARMKPWFTAGIWSTTGAIFWWRP